MSSSCHISAATCCMHGLQKSCPAHGQGCTVSSSVLRQPVFILFKGGGGGLQQSAGSTTCDIPPCHAGSHAVA
jgi:hypothetical protein